MGMSSGVERGRECEVDGWVGVDFARSTSRQRLILERSQEGQVVLVYSQWIACIQTHKENTEFCFYPN